MVTAKESHSFQQLSARKPPDSHHMALRRLEQKYPFLASVASPGQYNPNLRVLNTGQDNTFVQPSKLVPPILKDVHCASGHMFGLTDKPIDTSATQKRFLIFDQSGNHTRLLVSPSFTPQVLIASKMPATANVLCENVAVKMDNQLKPEIQEKWDRSDLADEEGEMREDTEEINALLYSSSDEFSNSYESDGDDDEVTSTVKIGEHSDKEKLLEKFLGEEVASSDDSPKRRKLTVEKYKKSPLTSAQCSYEDDSESNCAGDIDWSKREKKVKIRNALKIIESIIPGLESDDPVSIIDEAIIYLKSMRTEAEAIGLSQPESDSVTFS